MNKELSEMSLEELWRRFPIFLTPHQACWKKWYAEEEAALQTGIQQAVRISHIGSTAINSIWAKPIIDILLEVPKKSDLTVYETLLVKIGYTLMSQSAVRLSFNKGYTVNGFAEKVFHLHCRIINDNDELYFRDYLNEHPDIAEAYQQLKLKLWRQYEYDRDAYTKAKTEFIKRQTEKARKQYGKRY